MAIGTSPAADYSATNGAPHPEDHAAWARQTRIFLQPIAPPSILGLYGFAASTFMVAAQQAKWFGGPAAGVFMFPFALTFGGIAQFAAALWAYKARDGVATAMHGAWGSFWIAYGILWLLVGLRAVTIPATGPFQEFGFWFFTLAAITAAGAFAALAENVALFTVLATLTVGAALLGIRYFAGGIGWQYAGAWVLIASAILAFYTASAMMFEGAYGRVILPLGQPRKSANVPGHTATRLIEFHSGEPGVRHGQ